jgi:hypothetical protein
MTMTEDNSRDPVILLLKTIRAQLDQVMDMIQTERAEISGNGGSDDE